MPASGEASLRPSLLGTPEAAGCLFTAPSHHRTLSCFFTRKPSNTQRVALFHFVFGFLCAFLHFVSRILRAGFYCMPGLLGGVLGDFPGFVRSLLGIFCSSFGGM